MSRSNLEHDALIGWQDYVVGFIFSDDLSKVLLIQKQRPDWQRGKLNGIGGKIEKGEDPRDAMCRECFEECGLPITQWVQIARIAWPNSLVHFFYARVPDDVFASVRTMTDEPIFSMSVFRLDSYAGLIPNLNWLIPYCIYHHTGQLGGTKVKNIIDILES